MLERVCYNHNMELSDETRSIITDLAITLPDWYDDKVHRIYKNGAIINRSTGKFINNDHNINKITKENTNILRSQYINNRLKDKLVGILEGTGFNVDDIDLNDGEILSEYSSKARQILYKKLTEVFLSSDKLQGMSEVLEKLVRDETTTDDIQNKRSTNNSLMILIGKYVQGLSSEEGENTRQDVDNIIDIQ